MQKTGKNLTANALGCLILLMLINGCASVTPIEISAKPVEKPELILPDSDQLNLRGVDWIIITEENFEKQIAKLKEKGQPIVLFALTGEGYKDLSLNLSDIRAYIQQQQVIIYAFNEYYFKSQDLIQKANENLSDVKKQAEELQHSPEKKNFLQRLLSN